MRPAPRSIVRPAVLAAMALALLAPAGSGMARQRPEAAQGPRLEGPTIPAPPRQGDPWQPPASTLPPFLARASVVLFEQGLADPRGCDYREIEVGLGDVWSGGGGLSRTRGWVLPAAEGEKTRFAVAWNGLVYPVATVGEKADPAADVAALGRMALAAREERARPPGRSDSGFGGFGTNNEASAVSPAGLHAIKVCLLLRLGRADLAEAVWLAGTGRTGAEGKLAAYDISYVTLANDLAWYHFDRAICAQMRGDDALALLDARWLSAFQKTAEAQAEGMGFDRPARPGNPDGPPSPFIAFLDQLPDLLADQERRALEPKRPAPAPGGKPAVAALVADLDQVAARQTGQPGGVSLGESRIVQTLIEAGDPAVAPLIEDLERDTRLTRSVRFHRDFFRNRIILGAHEAAYVALSGILKTSSFGASSTGDDPSARGLAGRKAEADRVRAYWERNRAVPLVERWYRTLADDAAGPQEWLGAAGNIARPGNVEVIPTSNAFTTTVTTPVPPGTRPPLGGDALRDARTPSVAALMAARVARIDPGGAIDINSADQFRVGSANQMAEFLAVWDGPASLPTLKARVARSAAISRAGQDAARRPHGIDQAIADLTRLRVNRGDPEALGDYAAWALGLTPAGFDFSPVAIFEPLWTHPDAPAIAGAAASLFGDPKSPWNPTVRPGELDGERRFAIDGLGSPLLGLAPFRGLVLRALADRTPVGTIEAGADGTVTVIRGGSKTVSDARSTSVSSIGGNAPPPLPGPAAMPLRVADLAAEAVNQLDGVPRFHQEWPLPRRDAAIAATVAYLERYGERFRDTAAARAIREAEPGGPRFEQAILAFDPLDGPATPDDVARGRAIFSLAGAGAEVRRVATLAPPIAARWTKLEVFAEDRPSIRAFDDQGNEHPATEAMQAGRAWQVEEVREGDRWRRYYGFAGRHALARVAAEEIELITPYAAGWMPVSADLDARIRIGDAPAAGPVPCELAFRNHRGVEAMAPAGLARGDAAASIREGVAFRLVRVADQVEVASPFLREDAPGVKPFPPEEIPARPIRRHPGGEAARPLEPAAEVVGLRLDLRSLFAIDRPGQYRLEIRCDDLKGADGQPGVATAFFAVAEPKRE